MFKTVLFVAPLVVGSLLAGCGNKNYEKCLADAADYEKGKTACLAKPDKKEQEACVDANEVKKLTPADCAEAYK